MRSLLLLLISTLWLLGAVDQDYIRTLRAYLTSDPFALAGALYRYDFDGNGVYERDDWVYKSYRTQKIYRLFGTDPSEENPFGFVEVAGVDLLGKDPRGYFVYIDFSLDQDKRFSWIYLSIEDGCVYKLMGRSDTGQFDFLDFGNGPCDPMLTFEIENLQATIVYRQNAALLGLIDHVDTAGFSWSLCRNEDQLLVADSSNGVVLIDLLGKGLMQKVMLFGTKGMAYNVALHPLRRYAYVALDDGGIGVLDLTKKRVLNAYLKSKHVAKVLVEPKGGALYALVDGEGIYRFDLEGPHLLGEYLLVNLNGANDMLFCRKDLCVVDGCKGLIRINLGDWRHPTIHPLLPRPDLRTLALYDGRYLLVTDSSGGELIIYDADKGRHRSLRLQWPINKIVADGERIYLLHKIAMITAWNMGRPMALTRIRTYFLPYPATDLLVDRKEGVGYVADGGFGVFSMPLGSIRVR